MVSILCLSKKPAVPKLCAEEREHVWEFQECSTSECRNTVCICTTVKQKSSCSICKQKREIFTPGQMISLKDPEIKTNVQDLVQKSTMHSCRAQLPNLTETRTCCGKMILNLREASQSTYPERSFDAHRNRNLPVEWWCRTCCLRKVSSDSCRSLTVTAHTKCVNTKCVNRYCVDFASIWSNPSLFACRDMSKIHLILVELWDVGRTQKIGWCIILANLWKKSSSNTFWSEMNQLALKGIQSQTNVRKSCKSISH